MLRVTIELVPFGDETRVTTLSTIIIANTKETFEEDYVYIYTALLKEKNGLKEIKGKVIHNRKLIVFHLLQDVINNILKKGL